MKHHEWGTRSLECRNSVIPELAAVADLALELCSYDMSLVFGYRSPGLQASLVASGDSRTLKSAHCLREALDFQPAGFGDPFPRPGDPYSVVKSKLDRFRVCAKAWFEAADQLGFPLQWGNDWDIDGIETGQDANEKGYLQDMVHVQKAPFHRIEQAKNRAVERTAARSRGELVIS